MDRERDLDLLFEVGSLRHVPRMWRQFGGEDFANVAEHSFRVAWIALILSKWSGASPGRVVQLALVHDLAESRTGDSNYVQRMYLQADQTRAFEDASDGTSVASDLAALWDEWSAGQSLDAQVARDADQIDCDFELRERFAAGSTLPSLLADTRVAARDQLRTDAGRQLFDMVSEGDSSRWFRETRNRFTAGDWSVRRDRDA